MGLQVMVAVQQPAARCLGRKPKPVSLRPDPWRTLSAPPYYASMQADERLARGSNGVDTSSHGKKLSLRVRLIGGLLILLFLALFSLAVVVFVWQRLGLPADYLYAALVAAIGIDLVLLGLVADYRLRVLVARPVAQMVEGAERIAAGREEHRLLASDTVEIDRLSTAVNEMADRLIHNQQVLAANVQSLDATNRELSEARSSLVRSDKMASIGRLASGIAHEIGNPLGAIIGYVELGRRSRHQLERGWSQQRGRRGRHVEQQQLDGGRRGLLDEQFDGRGRRAGPW